MNIFSKLFGIGKKNNNIQTLEQFQKLNSDQRTVLIMKWGDSGKSDYFQFLKFAILNDLDIGVKFAALKRIHLFKNIPETIPMLNKLKAENWGKNYEPYFSMALSRLDIITLEEFSDIVNLKKD